MRLLLAAAATLVVTTGTAWAQSSPPTHPYGLDPYKPSDAALLREYGTALVAQTPLEELAALDPYKPSHAALLRLGGALPVWAIGWPTAMVMFDARRAPVATAEAARRDRMPRRTAAVERADAAPPTATAIATVRRPESNDGIWVGFEGRRWILAGRPVEPAASLFERVGDLDGHAIYRRRGGATDVIYIESGEKGIAPYRLKS